MKDYQKYIKALRKCAIEHGKDITYTGNIVVSDICRDTADLLEKLEQEPKTGHWIKQTLSVKPFGEDTVLCDQCAFMTDKDSDYRYCPNCGAKMESEDKE